MINFNYELDFKLSNEVKITNWASSVIDSEGFIEGDINYIFCKDEYLLKLNKEFLNHNTYTDIISFDYSVGKELHGDVYLSVDRIRDNARIYNTFFDEELNRVMVHGILHFCGYSDKSDEEKKQMREKENFYLSKLKPKS